MTPYLTGRIRLRSHKRLFRASLVVLQVEESIPQSPAWLIDDPAGTVQHWRDARPGEFYTLVCVDALNKIRTSD